MGFYGNITNTAKTQFQFDRIYPNRYEMEKSKYNDGIYAGRYVLVEYDEQANLDTFIRAQKKEDGFYYNPVGETSFQTLLTKADIGQGEIIYTAKEEKDASEGYQPKNCIFYRCISDKIANSEPAEFELIVTGMENMPNYTYNYNIDINTYGEGRGYDSTVWQKIYSDGIERYVMIAELNTVVPTFDVVADAPTMNPIVPHFDLQSTDVYYKLHWQAPWGFRVKEEIDSTKSDEVTTHTEIIFNPETGKTSEEEKNGIAAAIYYNKAAFDPQLNETSINKRVEDIEDEIKVEASGISGNLYNKHDGTTDLETKEDIQELTIHLPAIGNMMSDAWDIIHGPRRNNDMRQIDPDTNEYVGSLQGRLDSIDAIENNQIPIKRADNGQMVGTTINGDTRNTITDNLNAELSSSYESDDAWIETRVNADNTPNAIAIHHTFHATNSSVSSLDKNTGVTTTSDEYYKKDKLPVILEVDGSVKANAVNTDTGTNDIIKFYTPYVDAAGHVVGHNIETITLPYGYKTIKTNGRSNDENSDNSGVVTGTSTIADNTQDILNINSGNYWVRADIVNDEIKLSHTVRPIDTKDNGTTNLNKEDGANDEENITIPDWEYDKAGHIIAKKSHTYTLPFGFKTIKTNGRSDEVSENVTGEPETANIVADTTQDALTINSGNKWIRIDTDVNNDTLIIRHDVHGTSESDHNTNWTKTEKDTTIPVVTYNYDEAGHYLSHHTETYQLPFGYGKIKGDNGNTAATATYDELTFGSDDWLTATVSTDKVVFSHDYPKKIDDTTSEQDMNDNKKDTIILETLERDTKGHVIKVNQNTVTLPYGYKTFTGDSGSSSADNTQDSMAVNGDDWIKTTVSNDNILITHTTPVTGTSTSASTFTPNFGGEFKFNVYDFDTRGHKFNTTEHTVKIPEPSLTTGEGNVVTGLSLTSTSGAFVETKANLGTIKLGTFEEGDSLADITNDITLSQALSRLQNKIGNNNGGLTKKLNDEISRATQAEQNNAKAIQDLIGGDLPEGLKTIVEIATWINDQDNELNGVIDDVSELQSSKYDAETKFNYDEEEKTKTIQDLFNLVFNMQKTINSLNDELEQLKTKVNTEHPEQEVIPPVEEGQEEPEA